MSYILDALKRAEAQRHGAQPARSALPASFAPPPAADRATRILPWAGLLLAGGGALAVLAIALRDAPRPAPPPAPASETSAAAEPDAVTPPAVIIPPQAQAAPSPAPAVQRQSAALGTLRDLPSHVQREIPPLIIGGYLYSPVSADRSVLINNRLRREGDEVAPGLVLEALQANGMVLNYRGHRYRSNY